MVPVLVGMQSEKSCRDPSSGDLCLCVRRTRCESDLEDGRRAEEGAGTALD
jgi:hypothetical protein